MEISSKTARTGVGFVPFEPMRKHAGGFDVTLARHKSEPWHFRVEENHRYGQLTASTKSDFDPAELENSRGKFIAGTLVKSMLTSSAAARKLAARLGISSQDITLAGNKDRTAVTAQMFVISNPNVKFEDVLRLSEPDERNLREEGFFIKDIRRATKPLRKGYLEGNRFTLKTLHPGMSQADLVAYLDPRLNHLRNGLCGDTTSVIMSNFFGYQRLGRRQNLLGVGFDFILRGVEAAAKRFCCEVVEENDHPLATQLRKKLAQLWQQAEEAAVRKGEPVAKQHHDFIEMLRVLEEPEPNPRGRFRRPSYEPANMFIEHKLIKKIAKMQNFEEAFLEMRDDVSLWVGAVQGYWFNQALGKLIEGELPQEALERNPRTGENCFPLFFAGDNTSVEWYRRWMPEAIPEYVDPFVFRHFLSNADGSPGPRRPVYVPVGDLTMEPHNESILMRFVLRRGSYATVFLGLLFNLDGKDFEAIGASA